MNVAHKDSYTPVPSDFFRLVSRLSLAACKLYLSAVRLVLVETLSPDMDQLQAMTGLVERGIWEARGELLQVLPTTVDHTPVLNLLAAMEDTHGQ